MQTCREENRASHFFGLLKCPQTSCCWRQQLREYTSVLRAWSLVCITHSSWGRMLNLKRSIIPCKERVCSWLHDPLQARVGWVMHRLLRASLQQPERWVHGQEKNLFTLTVEGWIQGSAGNIQAPFPLERGKYLQHYLKIKGKKIRSWHWVASSVPGKYKEPKTNYHSVTFSNILGLIISSTSISLVAELTLVTCISFLIQQFYLLIRTTSRYKMAKNCTTTKIRLRKWGKIPMSITSVSGQPPTLFHLENIISSWIQFASRNNLRVTYLMVH